MQMWEKLFTDSVFSLGEGTVWKSKVEKCRNGRRDGPKIRRCCKNETKHCEIIAH